MLESLKVLDKALKFIFKKRVGCLRNVIITMIIIIIIIIMASFNI